MRQNSTQSLKSKFYNINSMDEIGGYYDKSDKPVTRKYILHDYMKCLN
jgi:hypothetical protein